jgi:hypothetical protein
MPMSLVLRSDASRGGPVRQLPQYAMTTALLVALWYCCLSAMSYLRLEDPLFFRVFGNEDGEMDSMGVEQRSFTSTFELDFELCCI